MPNKHQLSLEVPDTNNCSVFRIIDTSLYSDLLKITCGNLQITSPGFNESVSIEVLPHFNLVLNACTLGLQSSGCGSISETLPDGIYNVTYTVSPSNEVYVEYKYLRMCNVLNKYFNELCKIELAACEPEADVKEQLAELRLIKSFLDAAKVKVEYCESPEEGMDLFVYAQERLKKIGSTC
jgi:hypothetical protein